MPRATFPGAVYSHWWVSKGLNIKFCVKLGKSATETYSKCTVMKCYHVHVCLNGKRFHEGWETTEDDGRSGRPCTMCIPEKIWASPDSSCNKIVKLLSKCQISWTSARWPATKFCTRILAREKLMLTHARARGGLFCNLCQPFGNCRQKGHILLFHHHLLWNMVPTVRPTSKNTKCRVERHKPTCLKETLHPALKKNNVYCVFRLQREGICSKGSNCKPRCLHRCTATFMQEHSILSPWVVGNREVVPPTQRVAAYSIICQIFVSTSNSLYCYMHHILLICTQTIMTKQLCSIPASALQVCFKDLKKCWKQCIDAGRSYFKEDP